MKTLTSERLKKCQSRINQAVRDGCLEPYLADFTAAVKKAQQTPFLCGEGARGWRASFDWFVANNLNIYAVIEGNYDGPAAGPNNGSGGSHASSDEYFDCDPGENFIPKNEPRRPHLLSQAMTQSAGFATTPVGAGQRGKSSSA